MPAWLMLILIVVLSVALFADHRRNAADELTVDLDSGDVRRSPVRPKPRHSRVAGRPARAPQSRVLRVARYGRATRRR